MEAVTPPNVVAKVLRAAGDHVVLVGGQALAFWIQRYDLGLPAGVAAISADMDFLAESPDDRATVVSFARVIGGSTFFPNERALTSLVGQAYVDISDDEYINVNVIFKVIGIKPDAVRRRAVRAQIGQDSFLVMHPLDVLRSRLLNLHKLPDKQNQKGVMQLAMAIDVVREFLRAEVARSDAADVAAGRSPVQLFVSELERLAVEDAGRKVARRHGLHVANAIDPSLIPAGPFWAKRWPGLKGLMSVDYAKRFTAPPAAKAAAAGGRGRLRVRRS